MRQSRRILRRLAGLARQVLIDQAEPGAQCDPDTTREAGADGYVLLLGACLLDRAGVIQIAKDASSRALAAACDDVNAILVKLLPGQFRGLTKPAVTGGVVELFEIMRSSSYGSVWRDPYNLGIAYQYFLEADLEIFRNRSAGPVTERLVGPRTQQFTDKWIAEFLVHNTIGRIWQQMHPTSRLAGKLAYFVPLEWPTRALPAKRARDLRILDPACGTMNLGLAAFDLLVRIYREELAQAGRSGWPDRPSVECPDEIPRAILANNLFGVDMDVRPLALGAVAMFIKSGVRGTSAVNLIVADSLKLEGKVAGNIFTRTYDVVLLNPPYLAKRDYSRSIRTLMDRNFPVSGRNFYTAFLERSLGLVEQGGRLGTITPQTFMFIRSLGPVRHWLTEQSTIETLVHTGLNTFNDAVVDCAFYVLRRNEMNTRSAGPGRFFRLIEPTRPAEKARSLRNMVRGLRAGDDDGRVYRASQGDFATLPGEPWVYWITPQIRSIFRRAPSLADGAQIRTFLVGVGERRDRHELSKRWPGRTHGRQVVPLCQGRWFQEMVQPPGIRGQLVRRRHGDQGRDCATISLSSRQVAVGGQEHRVLFSAGIELLVSYLTTVQCQGPPGRVHL